MDILKLEECTGYSRAEAFQRLKFNPDHPLIKGTNCTQAWTQQGRPTPGTKDFKTFAVQQLQEKTMLKPGYGLYITLESPIPDIRKRPYTLLSQKVEATRQWSNIKYLIVESILSVNSLPNKDVDSEGNDITIDDYLDITVIKRNEIVDMCDSLSEAKQKMKRLTSETHKDYIAMPIKIPDINPISAYSIYTPSSGAKPGKFLAFGIDDNI